MQTSVDVLPLNSDRKLVQNIQELNYRLADTYETTIQSLLLALELHNGESREHAFRVAKFSVKLARAMGFPETSLTNVRRGALLHDVGKLGVPTSILNKPGPLTEEEWTIMRKHPENACELLKPLSFLRPALDIPRYHHEKWDGTGYPHGISGDKIPLSARIFAIVDVWDALRSKRPYRAEVWPENEVLELFQLQSGKHFDPAVVEAFITLIKGNLLQIVS